MRQNRGPFSDFVAFCHAGPFLEQGLEFYDKLRGGAGGERQLVLLVTELFELDGGSWARVDLLLVEHGQIAEYHEIGAYRFLRQWPQWKEVLLCRGRRA